jgi:uncharacterized RDD family membrane protein YckC
MTDAGVRAAQAASASMPAPSVRRRLAAFVYEGVLLFGVLFFADYVFGTLTQQRHALQLREVGMGFLFLVLGVYFVWFWSHGGQTLAMKTWHVKLRARDGGAVTQGRALARYLLSWIWFLPPLALVYALGVPRLGVGGTLGILVGYVLVYALSSRWNPQRQFWHDVVCGTCLVDARAANEAR